MMIGEVAQLLHITPRTIRFYEEKGLISPRKQEENRYRKFTGEEVWRLQTITALREIGLSLDDIRQALDQVERGHQDELLHLLELRRSAMFSEWLECKEQLLTFDRIMDLLKREETLPLPELIELTEGLKRISEARSSWKDRWNFDGRAAIHDDLVSARQGPFEPYETALDTVFRWVRPENGEHGLDIGTGTGNLAARFIDGGYRIAAVDQSNEMLKTCRGKLPRLETRLGNFLSIPYMDRQFDYAVSSFALHLLTDEQKRLALHELRRVLKPRGRICIADFMFEDEIAKREYLQEVKQTGIRKAYQAIDEAFIPDISLLTDWFEENGYITKQKQLSKAVHVLYAVPFR